ncbi:MAG: phosphoribosylamine--glycine ligase [Bacteroidales bacterium]|nr:MAG: phosphoribosylamine--glycine ligase [Bacteroidales bacterium]
MNVLIIGSGGREHTLAWKLSQSRQLDNLHIAPGNAGTVMVGNNVNIGVDDFEKIGNFVMDQEISLVVVGPEAPLVNGIHDYFLEQSNLKSIPVIGPVKSGAMLEGSKKFANEFMERYGIPTAGYKSIAQNTLEEGFEFLQKCEPPYVLKADGLAAGKGVLILDSLGMARAELKSMLDGKFGVASQTVVIEEFLNGIEASVFVLTDGESYLVFPEAKDYKRIGEGDTGVNTGGMGAVSPVPFADKTFLSKVEERIIKPTISGLMSEGIDYIGFLYFGLMNVLGDPFVVEYNVRMGDPEAQVVIPRIKNDLLVLLKAAGERRLSSYELDIDPRSVCTVVLASGGYPGSYEKGKEIMNLNQVKNSIIFHAGTRVDNDAILTSGGRVMAVSSYGESMDKALQRSYESAGIIKFDKMFYRRDIGFDLKDF